MINILSKKFIGLDISDHTIEVAELSKSGGKIKIAGLGRVELEPGIVEKGGIKNENKLIQAMAKVFNNALPNRIGDKNIIFGLPESQVFTHVFTINSQSELIGEQENSMEDLVAREARANIPLEEDEALFSYKILYQTKDETKILLAAAGKKAVLEWQKFFEKIKKDIKIFDIEILASRRSLFIKDIKEPVCIVDIGAATANIAIFNEAGLHYAYAINEAGDAMTQEIAKVLKIKTDKAEEIKIKTGIDYTESLIFTAIIKVLEQIIKEIQTALNYFKKNTGQSVKEIIFIGESSKLRNLADYFQTNLDMPVSIGRPELPGVKAEYIGAIGMALKGIDKEWMRKDPAFLASGIKNENEMFKNAQKEESELNIDIGKNSLLPQSDREIKKARKLRSRKIALAIILVVGLISIIFAFWFRHNNKIKREEEFKSKIEESLAPIKQTVDMATEETTDASADNKISTSTDDKIKIKPEENKISAPYAVIKKTETGWLNVRQGPGVSYKIISKINPGEKYHILTEEDDWVKIQLPDNLEGWIFEQYADKYID